MTFQKFFYFGKVGREDFRMSNEGKSIVYSLWSADGELRMSDDDFRLVNVGGVLIMVVSVELLPYLLGGYN